MPKRIKRIKHRTIDLRKIARGEDEDDDLDEEELSMIANGRVDPSPPPPPPAYTEEEEDSGSNRGVAAGSGSKRSEYTIGTPEGDRRKMAPKKHSSKHKKGSKPKLPILQDAVINATKAYIIYQEKLAELQKAQATLIASAAAPAPGASSSSRSSSDSDDDDSDSEDSTSTTTSTSSSYRPSNGRGDDDDASAAAALPPSYDPAASGEDEYRLKLTAVKQVLGKGRTDVNEADASSGRRALHYAGSGELVQALVDAGAEADAVDDMGCTALHVMAENGLHDAARVIINYCKKNYDKKRLAAFINRRSTSDGETALHLAARVGNLQICSFLLSANADPNVPSNDGKTALHVASGLSEPSLVSILVEHGSSVKAKDELGRTPLHFAAGSTYPNTDIILYLLKHGASVSDKDNNGQQPLEYAVVTGLDTKCHALQSKGADVGLRYRHGGNFASTVTSAAVPFKAAMSEDTSGKKYNKYGFLLKSGGEKSNIILAIPHDTPKTLRRDAEREKKWEQMLSSKDTWMRLLTKEINKLRRRCYKGIPPTHRGQAWYMLTGAEQTKNKHPRGYYQKLLQSAASNGCCDQIDMDINRCFRTHVLYAARYGDGQSALFNILRAYSIHDKEVGYCQGMCEVAALFLMFMPEENAFWTLVEFLNGQAYSMRSTFLPGFPALHTSLHCHDELIRMNLPKLYAKLQDQNVTSVMYATKWFITLFIELIPFEHYIRLWDVIMFEGVEIIHTIAIRLLEHVQKILLRLPFDEIMAKLLSFDYVKLSPDEFISTTTKNIIQSQIIKKIKLGHTQAVFREDAENASITAALSERKDSVDGSGSGSDASVSSPMQAPAKPERPRKLQQKPASVESAVRPAVKVKAPPPPQQQRLQQPPQLLKPTLSSSSSSRNEDDTEDSEGQVKSARDVPQKNRRAAVAPPKPARRGASSKSGEEDASSPVVIKIESENGRKPPTAERPKKKEEGGDAEVYYVVSHKAQNARKSSREHRSGSKSTGSVSSSSSSSGSESGSSGSSSNSSNSSDANSVESNHSSEGNTRKDKVRRGSRDSDKKSDTEDNEKESHKQSHRPSGKGKHRGKQLQPPPLLAPPPTLTCPKDTVAASAASVPTVTVAPAPAPPPAKPPRKKSDVAPSLPPRRRPQESSGSASSATTQAQAPAPAPEQAPRPKPQIPPRNRRPSDK